MVVVGAAAAVVVVAGEGELLGRNVLERRRDYNLFDYCCIVREDRIVPGSRVIEIGGYWKE